MQDKEVLLAKPALYIVGTPIGNLEDITLRALRVLKEVDVIACEDTRLTQKLLTHYGITTRAISYHEHNEVTRAAELVERLQQGAAVALVTDAGMPAVSDPGHELIVRAIEKGFAVVPVPGPSAFLSALVASGCPSDSFCFRGFLPAKRSERRAALQDIGNSSELLIFYEAPHRIIDCLVDIVEILGASRPMVLARELTKLHEEFVRGTAAEILESLKRRDTVKGEITLLIGEANSAEEVTAQQETLGIRDRVQRVMNENRMDEKAALKKVAKERGISKSDAYRQMQREK